VRLRPERQGRPADPNLLQTVAGHLLQFGFTTLGMTRQAGLDMDRLAVMPSPE
jgi:hypothetical protein